MARKRTYRVAVAQLRVDPDDQRLNACGILEAIDLAAEEQADFLVTPEMCLTGYHGKFDNKIRDGLVAEIRAAARAAKVTTILGAGDRRRGVVYNEQVVIDGSGRILGRHA
ncbi:MAG: nitrilase-related carbon-nitrogen hydrolase, partial [Planctomycetota bacterium]